MLQRTDCFSSHAFQIGAQYLKAEKEKRVISGQTDKEESKSYSPLLRWIENEMSCEDEIQGPTNVNVGQSNPGQSPIS